MPQKTFDSRTIRSRKYSLKYHIDAKYLTHRNIYYLNFQSALYLILNFYVTYML